MFKYLFYNFRLHENYDLLRGRVDSISRSKEQLELVISTKTQRNRSLISDMNALRSKIKRLIKQRDQIKNFLQDQNIPPEKIEQINIFLFVCPIISD